MIPAQRRNFHLALARHASQRSERAIDAAAAEYFRALAELHEALAVQPPEREATLRKLFGVRFVGSRSRRVFSQGPGGGVRGAAQ
jgi:hypothetical protein